jgi:hypothetical protein
MYCALIVAAGQCLLACGGPPDEFKQAWGEPRWNNDMQTIIDDHGPMPKLHRRGADVIWSVEAEPAGCGPVPKLKPAGSLAADLPKISN